jgi:predicted small lipoprotein YifL
MLVAVGSIVTGCGRRGALEAPANATVHDDWRKQDQKAVEEKPFILDKLI